jgi:hypothetical protein
MNKTTRIVEFQWLNTEAYKNDCISNQFNKWLVNTKLENDPNFKVISSNIYYGKNSEGISLETMFIIYEMSNIRY